VDLLKNENLPLLLVFFVPGFISIKIYDLLVPGERRDFSSALIEALGFGALNFAMLSWIVLPLQHRALFSSHPLLDWLRILLVFLVMPAVWPVVFLRVAEWPIVARKLPHPVGEAWDMVFRERVPYWTIVHLRDGRRIAGRYDSKSVASSAPASEQIFLEEVWELGPSGDFLKPIERSAGVLILGGDIQAVEFFT